MYDTRHRRLEPPGLLLLAIGHPQAKKKTMDSGTCSSVLRG